MTDKICPSMMCADILEMRQILETFAQKKIDYLHVDVMDGVFVPNLMLGSDFCKGLHQHSAIPLDIHLMIEEPERKIEWFPIQKGDMVSVHVESTRHLQKALAQIRALGASPYAALNPATPLSVLDYVLDDIDGVLLMTVNPGFAGQKLIQGMLAKIAHARAYLNERGRADAHIQVDGNVSFENAVKMKRAGADLFVVGSSSIFRSDLTPAQGIDLLREALSHEEQ